MRHAARAMGPVRRGWCVDSPRRRRRCPVGPAFRRGAQQPVELLGSRARRGQGVGSTLAASTVTFLWGLL